MIKIKKIEKNKDDIYFIIYEINKDVYTFNGTSKDIIDDLFKNMKGKNE